MTGSLAISPGNITAGVSALNYAPTIAVDASQGNHFRVTLGGAAALGNPVSGTDGQKVTFEVIQDATGGRTLSYGTAYAFGSSIPQPVLTTTALKRDFLGFCFNAASGLWYFVALCQNF